MSHDKFCPMAVPHIPRFMCICDVIAKVRVDEREQSAERVYQAWQRFDDYQTVECQQCYTKEAFDLAEQAARGEQA